MPVTVSCAGCGKEKRIPRCRVKKANFCSLACLNVHQRLVNPKHADALTPEEDAFLREHYYQLGPKECAARLSRSRGSVTARAGRLGLLSMKGNAAAEGDVKYTSAWLDRFWARVKKAGDDDCWEWQGNRNSHGYGTVRHTPEPHVHRSLGTHAVSYELAYGLVPEGRWVLHLCNNRMCFNPAHLYAGTATDNARDRDLAGRTSHNGGAKGERNHFSVLTEAQVLLLRQEARKGRRVSTIAREIGVSPHTAFPAVRGLTWKHLDATEPPVPRRPVTFG